MSKDEELKKLAKYFYPGGLLVIVMILVRFFEYKAGLSLTRFGLFPRSMDDFTGIFTFPFIHRDNQHLLSNSIPLFILSAMLFYFYREIAWKVLFFCWVLSGFWLWLGGRPSVHIGASGIVYGLASFIFFSGIWRRERRMMAVSLTVVFLYGGMVWGIFPLFRDMSWEGHLFGGLAGILLSWIYRKKGPQRIVYEWENEVEEDTPDAYSELADSTEIPQEDQLPARPASVPPTGPLFDLQPPQIRFDYIEKKKDADKDEQS